MPLLAADCANSAANATARLAHQHTATPETWLSPTWFVGIKAAHASAAGCAEGAAVGARMGRAAGER